MSRTVVTLRTVPRDDGTTSVVLTRSPLHPDDPEVMNVLANSREAVGWLIEQSTQLGRVAGNRLYRSASRYDLRSEGESSATVRLEIELNEGEALQVHEEPEWFG